MRIVRASGRVGESDSQPTAACRFFPTPTQGLIPNNPTHCIRTETVWFPLYYVVFVSLYLRCVMDVLSVMLFLPVVVDGVGEESWSDGPTKNSPTQIECQNNPQPELTSQSASNQVDSMFHISHPGVGRRFLVVAPTCPNGGPLSDFIWLVGWTTVKKKEVKRRGEKKIYEQVQEGSIQGNIIFDL